MNKKELILELAKRLSITKVEAEKFLTTYEETVIDSVKEKGEVKTGIGNFKLVDRKARNWVNPATWEKIKIAASTVIKFKLSKSIKKVS